jgi:hypothetical protein
VSPQEEAREGIRVFGWLILESWSAARSAPSGTANLSVILEGARGPRNRDTPLETHQRALNQKLRSLRLRPQVGSGAALGLTASSRAAVVAVVATAARSAASRGKHESAAAALSAARAESVARHVANPCLEEPDARVVHVQIRGGYPTTAPKRARDNTKWRLFPGILLAGQRGTTAEQPLRVPRNRLLDM